MTGVKPSDPNLSTAAYITRAALMFSRGVPGPNGVVEITLLLSRTQPLKKILS